MKPGGPISTLLRALAVLGIATIASPACAQHLAGGASPDVSIVRIIAALAVSLIVGVGLALAQRRFPMRKGPWQVLASLAGGLARARRIDVIEARKISTHADLCLVRCDTDEYLILSGPAGSTVLRSGPVPQPALVDAPGEEPPQ